MKSLINLIESSSWLGLSFFIGIIALPVGWFLATFAHWLGG